MPGFYFNEKHKGVRMYSLLETGKKILQCLFKF